MRDLTSLNTKIQKKNSSFVDKFAYIFGFNNQFIKVIRS